MRNRERNLAYPRVARNARPGADYTRVAMCIYLQIERADCKPLHDMDDGALPSKGLEKG